MTVLYINYVLNSNSIFRQQSVSADEAATLGLIDYPSHDSRLFDHNVILGSPKLPQWVKFSNRTQHAFQLINAFAGQRRQIHIFILVFDASQDVATALKQRAYWNGGNKNEFTVCLGVDFSATDSTSGGAEDSRATVRWCKAFSWCDIPKLESATESWFIEHRELSLGDYAEWLGQHLNLWKRKNFSDFKYLGINLSTTRKTILAIATVALCAAMAGIMYYIVDNTRQRNERYRLETRYDYTYPRSYNKY